MNSFKVPKKYITATKMMVQFIIHNSGGPAKVATLSGLSRQQIQNFIGYGYVPLKTVYEVSKALKVDVWELSHSKLMEVFGDRVPDLIETIKKSKHLTENNKEDLYKVLKDK